MQYHAHVVTILDSLSAMVDFPLQTISSTIATGYFLNASAVDGKTVSLQTGFVNASVSGTLYDARPVIMFSIDRVLIPREISSAKALAAVPAEAPVPEAAPPRGPIAALASQASADCSNRSKFQHHSESLSLLNIFPRKIDPLCSMEMPDIAYG
ncbi:hypothetical protein Mapa_009078 [Marchantia paleacea]|nr:hypothetical protein Mapa_009078 [Marchantia paleacea]